MDFGFYDYAEDPDDFEGSFGHDDFDDMFDDPSSDASEDYDDDEGYSRPESDEYNSDDIMAEIEQEIRESEQNDGISATEIGLVGSFVAHVADKNQYDLDENTDKENEEAVKKLISLKEKEEKRTRSKLRPYNGKLRPFERYVQDILDGKRSLFDDGD